MDNKEPEGSGKRKRTMEEDIGDAYDTLERTIYAALSEVESKW
ncbi:MAG: hypothetical protein A4E30_01257 [Methanomassiliicoccales archaeon PtaB.Bin215]|nr:MAG: hypothetical protein A4E30_01257 [Methanomassiliicoccales archaeon PtaB.Bin215]